MANQEHVEILRQGVEAWNKWRKEHTGVVPDLTGADLNGKDLQGAYFQVAKLIGAKLNGADLTGAYLIEADITGAELQEVYLNRAKLNRAHLDRAKLNRAYLYGANLSGAHLNRADLEGANLEGADLSRADLSGANLTGANLQEAFLNRAYLNRAYLTGANLTGAHLYGADLSEADLANADLSNAKLSETKFLAVDLGLVRGLELATHSGPSHIDIQTFQLSQGNIPEIFLRGVGLSDEMISFFRTLYGKPVPSEYYSCFISYSHEDETFARRLHDTLQERGIRCWLDKDKILPGDDLFEQIDRGIRLWDKTLLCCSEHSLTSWWVDNEIKIALGKEQELMKEHGKRVLALIPLDLDGYLFKWERGMAQEVKSRMAPDFKGWEHNNSIFEGQLERVVKALITNDAGREIPPPPRLGQSPP